MSARRTHAFARDVAPAATASFSVAEVDEALVALQGATGPGSLAVREDTLRGLLGRATPEEARSLVGLLSGDLRQGALEGVVLEGIAKASGIPSPVVRRAAMLSGDLPRVALLAQGGGEAALRGVTLQLFVPVLPMRPQQPPPRGPRRGDRRLRDAGQDVQGDDR